MKVLASRKDGYIDTIYICEVSHNELEKFLNLYYGKFKELKDGDTVDLSKGYDFAQEAKEALKTTEMFIKNNSALISSIMSGINVFSTLAEQSNTSMMLHGTEG